MIKILLRYLLLPCIAAMAFPGAVRAQTTVFQDPIANYIATRTYENCNSSVVRTQNYGTTSIATTIGGYTAASGDQFVGLKGASGKYLTLAVPKNVTDRYGQIFIRMGKDPTNYTYTHIRMSSSTAPTLTGGYNPTSTGAGAYLTFEAGGDIAYHNGSSLTTYPSFPTSQLFNVTINYDLVNKTYDVWINSTKIISGAGFADSSFGSTVGSIVIGESYWAAGTTTLDQWYWQSSPSSAFTGAGTALTVASPSSGVYTVALSPGEGTVLCVGSSSDFSAIQQQFFNIPATSSPTYGRTPGSQYQFPCILRGAILSGTNGALLPLNSTTGELFSDYQSMGITVWQWYDQLFQILNVGGANTIYFEGGISYGKPNIASSGDHLECQYINTNATAFPYGFKTILQNDDTYFTPPTSTQFSTVIEPEWQSYMNSVPSGEIYTNSYVNDTSIYAWAPVQELAASNESAFTAYKAYLNPYPSAQVYPNQLICQIDSPQSNASTLGSKQQPYPDIFGSDLTYLWSCALESGNYQRFNPYQSATTIFSNLQQYAAGIEGLSSVGGPGKCQGVAVLQGPAKYQVYAPGTQPVSGWVNSSGWVDSTSGFTYYSSITGWGGFDWNLPPQGGERQSIWNALCAGLKGALFWDAVDSKPSFYQGKLASNTISLNQAYGMGIIHSDLTTTTQWSEAADTFRKLSVFDRVIPGFSTSGTQFMTTHASSGTGHYLAENGSTEDPYLLVNSFLDQNGRQYVVLQNIYLGANGTLGVDANGNLTGFTPTDARPCTITLTNSSWSVIPAETLAPVNFVPNGNMETSTDVSGVETPQGWSVASGPATINADHSSISATLDSMFTTPNTAMHIAPGVSTNSWIYSSYIYGIQGGKTYQLSAWIYTTAPWIGIQEYESSGGWGTQGTGGYLVQDSFQNHWVHVSYQFTTRSGSTWMLLGALAESGSSGGDVYLDDVTLNLVGP